MVVLSLAIEEIMYRLSILCDYKIIIFLINNHKLNLDFARNSIKNHENSFFLRNGLVFLSVSYFLLRYYLKPLNWNLLFKFIKLDSCKQICTESRLKVISIKVFVHYSLLIHHYLFILVGLLLLLKIFESWHKALLFFLLHGQRNAIP